MKRLAAFGLFALFTLAAFYGDSRHANAEPLSDFPHNASHALTQYNRGPLATAPDGTEALVYISTYTWPWQWWVRLESPDGTVRHVALPLPADNLITRSDQQAILLTSFTGNMLYVLGGNTNNADTGAVLYEISIDAPSGFALLLHAEQFAPGVHIDMLLGLPSGALVALVNDRTVYFGGVPRPAVYYRSPAGDWQSKIAVTPDPQGGFGKFSGVLVQRGDDGSVWAFTKNDGANGITASRFVETTAGFVLTSSKDDFIYASNSDTRPDGSPDPGYLNFNGPHGEQPWLAAIYSEGSVYLAYQSYCFKFTCQYPDVTLIGANIAIAKIAADGAYTYLPRAPILAERVSRFAFLRDQAGVFWIAYIEVDEFALTKKTLSVTSLIHESASWLAPQRLGFIGTDSPWPAINHAPDRPVFTLRMADGVVHRFEMGMLTPPPTATPSPTATATPAPTATPTPVATVAPAPTPVSLPTCWPPSAKRCR